MQFDGYDAVTAADDIRFTYSHLAREIAAVATKLAEHGIGAGDVVSLSLVNGVEFAVTFLAITWIRAAAAPLNPSYTREEVEFYLDDTKCKALIVHRGGSAVAREGAASLGVPLFEISRQGHLGERMLLQPLFTPTILRTVTCVRGARPDDVALILHTSGTTSRPKGDYAMSGVIALLATCIHPCACCLQVCR